MHARTHDARVPASDVCMCVCVCCVCVCVLCVCMCVAGKMAIRKERTTPESEHAARGEDSGRQDEGEGE
jgi:hypothetical protein